MEVRRWHVDSAAALRRAVRALAEIRPDPRRPFEIIARDPFRGISGGQRGHFHAVCSAIGERMGETPRRTKEMIKEDYFGAEKVRVGRRVYKVIPSTEDLDGRGYQQLIEFAYQWAAEREIELPERRPRTTGGHR